MAVETDKNWPPASRIKDRAQSFLIQFHILYRKALRAFGFHRFFVSLWQRIVLINVLGLIIFTSGVFYLNEFRNSLIESNVRNLEAHGEIIAVAIATTSTPSVSQNSLSDLEDLFNAQDKPLKPEASRHALSNLEFPINPENIGPIIRYLLEPTNTRARIYRSDGELILDSDDFYSKGQIVRKEARAQNPREKSVFLKTFHYVWHSLWGVDLPLYKDIGKANGRAYPEVITALTGTSTRILRVNDSHETIVSVAVPIKHFGLLHGALLLSTRAGEIDDAVSGARLEIFRVAFIALFVTILLSMYLAGTIARPMRRLAAGAERVRKSIKAREEIPNLTYRKDEIGYLSKTLREMTSALYARIDAIECFAADVSHELKNPMTSLKSAAETLEIAKTEEDRAHLVDIIRNDVGRLNRLITDISDASRLDAELAKGDTAPVNIVTLVETVVNIFNDIHRSKMPKIEIHIEDNDQDHSTYIVHGHDGRLGQVLNNLLDNAISFIKQKERVWVCLKRTQSHIRIIVEDQGPGIPEDNIEKIFNRFYTDRPGEESFGENSGLGLNISRQIVIAHGGKIWAENRYSQEANQHNADNNDTRASLGARFVVSLPIAHRKQKFNMSRK
ncbi:MAG: stimulus-sensing domain-containing protein [Pseudomonadota bacterium]